MVQPEYELTESATVWTNKTKSGKSKLGVVKYISDFRYIDNDEKVIVVDTKGINTAVFMLKMKLFLPKLKEFQIDEFWIVYKDKTIKYYKDI